MTIFNLPAAPQMLGLNALAPGQFAVFARSTNADRFVVVGCDETGLAQGVPSRAVAKLGGDEAFNLIRGDQFGQFPTHRCALLDSAGLILQITDQRRRDADPFNPGSLFLTDNEAFVCVRAGRMDVQFGYLSLTDWRVHFNDRGIGVVDGTWIPEWRIGKPLDGNNFDTFASSGWQG